MPPAICMKERRRGDMCILHALDMQNPRGKMRLQTEHNQEVKL